MLAEFAPAKVNLYLHVTGRRPDGYHELDSLTVFADVGDILRAEPADALSLTLAGPFAAALDAEPDNLVLRAARVMAARAGRSPDTRLTLHKNLPVAAGIGGGSADAAACLRLLGRLWGVAPNPDLAVGLGADVLVCLAGQAHRMQGIGERLLPAPNLPECGLALVNPGVPLATASVFRARTGEWSRPACLPPRWPAVTAMAAELATLANDLEPAAAALCPPLHDVLAALAAAPDNLLARMSGSGSTCFGLFPDPSSAQRAAAALRRPGWWTWGGRLLTG